ncbi:MAG: phosphate ABC transporter ATP-binding protein [Deltaproteobacteria bacterium]|nr:phosphate ABC transporter ATP-binding protein [Deltaproteobacteria bacterium]MBW1952174.1 phosphate ABC transporter ATP-binding protein [Deltaproteobacteria bacterium]MBW1985708.1 phosphate ABC transporter ATP-binding protein [Deltaproteobacteria bacterium]MBW2134622.1 phosphate ABC transporter ATP-binding protein [Deltaproteobacteria bacterium]
MSEPIIILHFLNLYYGSFHALKDINATFSRKRITALIGPSGCGKSTLLRVLNRMNDPIEGVSITGQVLIEGEDIYRKGTNLIQLRKKVGMVFQRPNPFPLSIYDNIVYGPRLHGRPRKAELEDILVRSLEAVHMWDEVKDRLSSPALSLTEEQQQRLCIARLLAVEPEILLMDEPCSALDPLATLQLEELMRELIKDYTIIIVTHNMQQAARVSDDTGFMLLGELVEFAPTPQVFTRPKDQRTDDYISGKYG